MTRITRNLRENPSFTDEFPSQMPAIRSLDVSSVVKPEQTVDQIVELPVIKNTMPFMWRYCNVLVSLSVNI